MQNRIIQADSLTFTDVRVDHIFTDPPYSPHVHKSAATMRGGKAGSNDLGFGHLTPELRSRIANRVALASSWSVIFSDWEGLEAWRQAIIDAGAEYIRAIPWIRWSMPQLSGDRPPQGSECVIVAHAGGKKKWNGPGNLTHFDTKCMRGAEKHKTQKPLELMMQIVDWFSEPGASVLDPCAGSGTTIVACAALGRKAIGLEIDADWATKGQARLESGTQADYAAAIAGHELLRAVRADKERMAANTAKILAAREARA